jgi:hypothetical protein
MDLDNKIILAKLLNACIIVEAQITLSDDVNLKQIDSLLPGVAELIGIIKDIRKQNLCGGLDPFEVVARWTKD